MPLKVEPILSRFGAECSGLDLTKPLIPAEVKQVTDAMDAWGVTVWRNTGMNDDQHVEFSRNFGYLERVPRREGVRFRLPHRELFDASNLNVDGEITQDVAAIQYRKGDRLWHTDSAFMESAPAIRCCSRIRCRPKAARPRSPIRAALTTTCRRT